MIILFLMTMMMLESIILNDYIISQLRECGLEPEPHHHAKSGPESTQHTIDQKALNSGGGAAAGGDVNIQIRSLRSSKSSLDVTEDGLESVAVAKEDQKERYRQKDEESYPYIRLENALRRPKYSLSCEEDIVIYIFVLWILQLEVNCSNDQRMRLKTVIMTLYLFKVFLFLNVLCRSCSRKSFSASPQKSFLIGRSCSALPIYTFIGHSMSAISINLLLLLNFFQSNLGLISCAVYRQLPMIMVSCITSSSSAAAVV